MKTQLMVLFVLLNSFVYAQIYSPTYISKTDFKTDIKFLKEKVTNIHPKCLDKKFSEAWEKQYNMSLYNLGDSLTFNECYIRLSPLMSIFKDGHSNFSFPYTERLKYMNSGGTTMPLTVTIKNNAIYIDKYFGKTNYNNINGYEILSINGIKSEKILEKLQIFYGAKSSDISNHNIERYFGAYFWTVFGEFSQYIIEIVKEKKIVLLKLNPVTNSEYFALKKQLFPKQKEKKYELLFFDNNNLAYLKIKSFAKKQIFTNFVAKAFDTINAMNCKNLIIDVRNNFGGTSDCVDTILSYLTNKPYKQYASIGLRTSEEIKTKYKNKQPKLYKIIKDLNDTIFYYTDNMLNKEPVFHSNLFFGSIFVLVNEKTFSAASTFAGVIKKYNIGKIVGKTETGGTIEYYGDFLFYKLPKTKMEFFVSPKIFVQYGGNNLNKGVLPDIVVKDDSSIKMLIKELKTNADNVYKK